MIIICSCVGVQGKGEIETWWLLGEDNPDFPDLAASSSPTLWIFSSTFRHSVRVDQVERSATGLPVTTHANRQRVFSTDCPKCSQTVVLLFSEEIMKIVSQNVIEIVAIFCLVSWDYNTHDTRSRNRRHKSTPFFCRVSCKSGAASDSSGTGFRRRLEHCCIPSQKVA